MQRHVAGLFCSSTRLCTFFRIACLVYLIASAGKYLEPFDPKKCTNRINKSRDVQGV